MNSIPDDTHDGGDPQPIDEILAAMAEQLGELEQPGDNPEDVAPAIIGMAYRLGRAAGETDEEIAASLCERPDEDSHTITIFKLGERFGAGRAASRMIEHGQQEYWNGYAKAIEDAFGVMDPTDAQAIASEALDRLYRYRRRPLVPQQRGRRTTHVQARRFAVARRVES